MPKEDTQFKSGVSGNPNGRPPKEHTLTELLKDALDQPYDDTGKTKKQLVIDRVFELATADKGDVNMLKYLFDRLDGRPRESIDLNHSGGINIILEGDDLGL